MKKAAKKPTRTPVPDRRYQQALDLFTKGVKALGRKDFDRARELFDELLEEHSDQKELLERARAYRAMCNRTRRPGRPKTFEELLNYGVILHNRGEFAQAVKFLRQALEIQPRNENALYCLAAAQARAGDPERGPADAALGDQRQPGDARAGPQGRRLRAAARRSSSSGRSSRRRCPEPVASALDEAEQQRAERVAALVAAGVRVEDPGSTHVGPEVVVEAGAVLRPFTILEGRSVVRAGAAVGPFVRLVDTEVGRGRAGARPLPAARERRREGRERRSLRAPASRQPGRRRRRGSATSSSSRRRELGDGLEGLAPELPGRRRRSGRGVNIGAGTITCNYDGETKSPTAHRGRAPSSAATRSWSRR